MKTHSKLERAKTHVLLLAAVGLAMAALFIGCGDSGGNGSLLIEGSLVQSGGSTTSLVLREESDSTTPIANAVVSALGDSDVTASNGSFKLYGDASNIPAQTLLDITIPGASEADQVVVDTLSGDTPFRITVTRNADGSYVITALSDGGGSGDSGGDSGGGGDVEPTQAPEETSAPEETAPPEATAAPEPTGIPEATATTVAGFDYDCTPGVYNSTGGTCGVTSFTLLSQSGDSVILNGFGSNSSAEFQLVADNQATGTGLVILNVGDHTCTVQCNSSSNTITLTCFNDQGGSCSQTFG